MNSAFADDFDTAKAVHAILKLISVSNKMIQAKQVYLTNFLTDQIY